MGHYRSLPDGDDQLKRLSGPRSKILFFAFFVGEISDTIVESIYKIGSLLNGPLLAVFMMGMLTRRVNGQGATGGLIIGFTVNLLLWRFAPQISWLWWNVIGFITAFTLGYLISL